MSERVAELDGQAEAARLVALLGSHVQTANGPVGADELWARVAEHPYVKHMDSQPCRFSDFAYDERHMVQDMGIDILPRDHQMQTGLFVAWILEREFTATGNYPIGREETGILMLATLIHDIGETTHDDVKAEVGAVVGDIAFGKKKDSDRETEAAVRRMLYREILADVDPVTIERVEAIISHQDTTVLHDLYEAAHDLQALNTAVNAGKSFARKWWGIFDVGPPPSDDSSAEKLSALYTAVFSNMIPRVRRWADQFAFADDFMWEHADLFAAHYHPN